MEFQLTQHNGGKGPRILIVDDDDPVREVLCSFFREEGFEVREASHGSAALDMVRKERFDLVLSDLVMPGLSGLDVLREIKNNAPETVVLIMTAYPSPETSVRGLELCGDGYISKPMNLGRLKSTVVEHLIRRRWERHRQPWHDLTE